MTSSTFTVVATAQASIGAAAKELHLPAEPKQGGSRRWPSGNGKPHIGYLAEVLAAVVDDRLDRRRTRRINEAHFLRVKRLADFYVDVVPASNPPSSPRWPRAVGNNLEPSSTIPNPTRTPRVGGPISMTASGATGLDGTQRGVGGTGTSSRPLSTYLGRSL